MARQKKPRHEYVATKQLYRKRVKGRNGGWIAIYGRAPDELASKIEEFTEDLRFYQDNRENPLVTDYADYWINLKEGHLTYGTFEDYKNIINRNIKPAMQGIRMRDVRHDDISRMMKLVANFSKSVHDKTYMIAKQIFTNAYKNNLILNNPCPQMHAGGKEPKERQALTREQIKTIEDAVKGTRAYVFCRVTSITDFLTYLLLKCASFWSCENLLGDVSILHHAGGLFKVSRKGKISFDSNFRWVENSPPIQYVPGNFQYKKRGTYEIKSIPYPLVTAPQNRLFESKTHNPV